MSFDPNHMIFDSTDSQYVGAYHMIMSDFLLMSPLLTMPIFPKCANIGAVFWATVARMKMMERTMNRTKPFKVNDQVWLESKNLKIPYQLRKLAPKWEGPFKIKEVLGPVTYRLTLPKQWRIHDIFHACLLMLYKETNLHKQRNKTTTWFSRRKWRIWSRSNSLASPSQKSRNNIPN